VEEEEEEEKEEEEEGGGTRKRGGGPVITSSQDRRQLYSNHTYSLSCPIHKAIIRVLKETSYTLALS
jgi:hypothetical protein